MAFPDYLDPNNNPYQDFPIPEGGLENVPQQPQAQAAPEFDLNAYYQQQFGGGRTPDANEMATDMENIGKYGIDAFKQDFQKRLDTRTPEEKGYGAMSVPNAAQMAPNPAVSGFQSKLEGYLDKILSSGGMFDEALVKRQKESAKDQIDMARTKRVANLRNQLASKGLLSLPGSASGAEASALGKLDSELGATYGGAIRDIFSNEQARASDRFMSALGLGTNYQNNVANQQLGQGRLSLDRDLGMGRLDLDRLLGIGNLGLGQAQNELAAKLGIGRLELDSEIAKAAANSNNSSIIQKILEELRNAANTSSGGYY